MRRNLLLIVMAAALAPAAVARAQPNTVVATAPPPAAAEPPSDAQWPRLFDRTALTLDAHQLQVGVLALDYGITNWLTVGSDPPAWALRSVTTVLVPNLHIKFVPVRRAGLWVALRVAGYYVFAQSSNQTDAHVLVVPASLFVSGRITRRLWLHGEGTFLAVEATGGNDLGRTDLRGAAAVNAAQVGLTAEYRLTRVVALTAWGRYQPWAGTIALQGTATRDGVDATIDARVTPRNLHPWAAVAGVALLWTHVRLTVGAGYGNYFFPGMFVPLPDRGIVPDANLSLLL
jgi:hypothetical protein